MELPIRVLGCGRPVHIQSSVTLSDPVSRGEGEAAEDTSVPRKGKRETLGAAWDGGNRCEVSPGGTTGLVVFLWLLGPVSCVCGAFGAGVTGHNQTSSAPHVGDGGKVRLGASGGGCRGAFPSVTSPPLLLSPTRGHWCCQDSLTEPVKLKIVVGEEASHLLGSGAAVGSALWESQKKGLGGGRRHALSGGLSMNYGLGAEQNHSPATRVMVEGNGRGREAAEGAKAAAVPLLSFRSPPEARKAKAAGTHRLRHSEAVGELPESQHHERPTVRCFLGRKRG